MKRNSHYILKRIAKIPYLLPMGQMTADHKHSVQINETGVYLWNLLKKDCSLDELILSCAQHYNISAEDPALKKDILHFTASLTACGALISPENHFEIRSPFYQSVNIAGLTCSLFGAKEAFSQNFNAFTCERPECPHQSIEVLPASPQIRVNGKLLLRNPELYIIKSADHYTLLFPKAVQIREAHLSKDGTHARFYCMPPFTARLRNDLFHAIRFSFLYLAGKFSMAALHSASVLYREKAWLFSASSGTGKSTHTNRWNTLFHTPVINGDLNLLAIKDGQAVIHGIPWCGTSGIYDTRTYSLGGIILLQRSSEDYVETLSENQKRLLVLQRLISTGWNKSLLDRNLDLIDTLVRNILVCRLACTPQDSAVMTVKKHIDAYLDR